MIEHDEKLHRKLMDLVMKVWTVEDQIKAYTREYFDMVAEDLEDDTKLINAFWNKDLLTETQNLIEVYNFDLNLDATLLIELRDILIEHRHTWHEN